MPLSRHLKRPFRPILDYWMRIGRRELWILLALLIPAAGLLGFASISDEVLEGDTRFFDRAVLLAMRGKADLSDPLGPAWFEEMARDITSLGGVAILTLVTLGTVGYLAIAGRRSAALLVIASVGGGVALSSLLKMAFSRARPDVVAHLAPATSASFPSGHTMLATVTFLTLGALLIRLQSHYRLKIYLMAVAVFLSVLVGLSRVYLGVHWPTDVLAGWCVGAAWAILCWAAALWLQHRGRVERIAPDEPID